LKVERVVHHIWQEWESIPIEVRKEVPLRDCIVGKYQYIYTKGKIRISLVKLNHTLEIFGKGRMQNFRWEICGGGLTDDCETFATKNDAVKRIKELLKE